jgi:hypothetical protein
MCSPFDTAWWKMPVLLRIPAREREHQRRVPSFAASSVNLQPRLGLTRSNHEVGRLLVLRLEKVVQHGARQLWPVVEARSDAVGETRSAIVQSRFRTESSPVPYAPDARELNGKVVLTCQWAHRRRRRCQSSDCRRDRVESASLPKINRTRANILAPSVQPGRLT